MKEFLIAKILKNQLPIIIFLIGMENNRGCTGAGAHPLHFRSLKGSLFGTQDHTDPLVGMIHNLKTYLVEKHKSKVFRQGATVGEFSLEKSKTYNNIIFQKDQLIFKMTK